MRSISLTLSTILSIFMISGQYLLASDNHIPHSHDHGTRNCRGYAMGRYNSCAMPRDTLRYV